MSSTYDIVRIKAQLPTLSELLVKDGHELRRSGTAMFMRCAFHEEKSGSCHVDDSTGRFHCFGCGTGGDIFDYWQKSRGLSFQDSLAQLAGIAGVGPQVQSTNAVWLKPEPVAKPEDKTPDPMTGDALARWNIATDALEANEREIHRIAEWRGIDPECIRFAASRGLMGSFLHWGVIREAFLVEMPSPAGLLPVSVHIRLAPGSKRNETSSKPSWRFEPTGCGSWPFIIGDLATAEHIFLLEGQWDALAMVSVMKWYSRPEWPNVAVVGLRGSTSGGKMLKHTINPKAQLFAIADADGAGAKWFEDDGLLAKLHERVRNVTAFWPTTERSDFNDLVKAGDIDRPLLLAYLQPMMVNPRTRTTGVTFASWCKKHTKDPDPIGKAATYVGADKGKPKGRRPLKAWEGHWRRTQVPSDLFGDLTLAWNSYRQESP